MTTLDRVGGGAGYCTPIKMTVGSIPTYVCLLGQEAGVVGVHAKNGKVLWQYNGVGASGGTAQIPVPVISGNRVWVSCSYSPPGAGSALLELTPEGTEKIDVKVVKTYKKPEGNNHHGGMVLVGKHVFFGHDQNRGRPACFDITTGERIYLEDKEPAGGSGSAAITYADGRLYYRFQNHVMALVEPDPTQFKLVSSFRLPEAQRRSRAGRTRSWPTAGSTSATRTSSTASTSGQQRTEPEERPGCTPGRSLFRLAPPADYALMTIPTHPPRTSPAMPTTPHAHRIGLTRREASRSATPASSASAWPLRPRPSREARAASRSRSSSCS